MGSLVYFRLIGFTAGTLLQLFWMVVILGYRRQRNFERVLFFLCLALFLFYSGSLLALNAQLHYLRAPISLQVFSGTLIFLGLCLLPALLVHLHLEYASTRGLLTGLARKRVFIAAAYLPVVFFVPRLYPLLANYTGFDLLVPSEVLGSGYGVWLVAAILMSCWWQWQFAEAAPEDVQRAFHRQLSKFFILVAFFVAALHVIQAASALPVWMAGVATGELNTGLAILALIPLAVMLRMVEKFNFLNIGRQKNLVYAASVTFLALLYLSLVRRVSGWLEPLLPPEATAAILLFLLVVFVEPLQRALGRRLQETAHREMDRVQKLTTEIQQEARKGNLKALLDFTEKRVKEQFGLAAATLTLLDPAKAELPVHLSRAGEEPEQVSPAIASQLFPVRQKHGYLALLRAEPYGAAISGETRAALEFLCEQLPGALDLCRLIEEKLQLERELAERERLAVLGQMAASISHNLKNPLGSIKTILQVQMENPELPPSIRGETKMVLEEIGRLSSKLNQLLQFSRPAIRGGAVAAICEARAMAEEVSGVLRHEAERRGVALQVEVAPDGATLGASPEAVSEILSNLVVNALEATAGGGFVKVSGRANGAGYLFAVEDDGPGVPESVREKILQPFFTTKTQGTGLGLAIVARRVAEFGGKLDWESPVRDGQGTRFEVTLPMRDEKK